MNEKYRYCRRSKQSKKMSNLVSNSLSDFDADNNKKKPKQLAFKIFKCFDLIIFVSIQNAAAVIIFKLNGFVEKAVFNCFSCWCETTTLDSCAK